MTQLNTRLLAANILSAVFRGQSLTSALKETQAFALSAAALRAAPQGERSAQRCGAKGELNARDRAFVQMLCYGVCRFYPQLMFVLQQLLIKPLPNKAHALRAILLVGLYQLMHTRVPPHAAISETVNAAGQLKQKTARSLTNAILRNYCRQQDVIQEKIKHNEVAHFAHPAWLITAIKEAWPKHWQSIFTANNQQAPLSLRVNRLSITREDYVKKYPELVEPIPETEEGVNLKQACAIEDVPGFAEGEVSVQDGAAQFAASLLTLAPGMHVLDACAAPGGKLTHLLEKEPALNACLAIDNDADRVETIRDNLQRLHLKDRATLKIADAANPDEYWDGRLFDRILCDAPCSASGVIRRHPDIKLLRKAEDIAQNAALQYRLLAALWPLLKKNGILLYATCSLLPAENVEVVRRFIQNHQDASEDSIHATWGVPCVIGRQVLPGGPENMDGFYYARLRKR